MTIKDKEKKNKKKEKYFLYVNGQLIDVKEDVYFAYYEVHEHNKKLNKKDRRRKLVHYAAWDTYHSTGEEEMPDEFAESVEDAAIRNIMVDKLRDALNLLSDDKCALIEAIYLSNGGEGMTEREYSAISGIPRQTVHTRKIKILAELKGLIT